MTQVTGRRSDARPVLYSLLLASVSTAALAAPALAFAQQAAEASVEELVVTALKRDTKIQETPISISAITGETLRNSGVDSLADLTSTVPSLTVGDGGPSNRSLSIRGIASAGEPTVGLYYDETPVTGLVGATNNASTSIPELRLFDVQRVEVLRGPQGTLYGSGSMGGTLRVIYNKPDFTHEAAVDVSVSGAQGGGVNSDTNLMLNVPVTDKLAVRATGFYQNNDGWIDNVFLGQHNVNTAESYGGRFMARYAPIENLTIDAAAYINRSNSVFPSWFPDKGEYKTDAHIRQTAEDATNLYSLTVNYKFDAMELTASSSFMARNLDQITDTSQFIQSFRQPLYCLYLYNGLRPCSGAQLGAYYGIVDADSTSGIFPHQHLDAYTDEVRLTSLPGRPLNWTVGAFWSDRITHVDNPLVAANPTTGEVIYPLRIGTDRTVRDDLKQTAVYGELSWDVTQAFNLTAGLRWFDYGRDVLSHTLVGSVLLGAVAGPPVASSASENGVISKFDASYKITPNVMVYAQASQGFRPGGVNQAIAIPAQFATYRSDSLWNYEAGVKTTSFHNTLTFDLDGFEIDWSDLQTSAQSTNGAFSFIANAGAARVTGLEADATWRPIRGLLLEASGNLMDARLTQNQTTANLVAPGVKGDRMPGVPRGSANLAAQYRWPLTSRFDGFARVDLRYTGGSYSGFNPASPSTVRDPAYALVNLRLGAQNEHDGWGAYVFATNLLNRDARVASFTTPLTFNRDNVISAQPRTVGVNVRKTF